MAVCEVEIRYFFQRVNGKAWLYFDIPTQNIKRVSEEHDYLKFPPLIMTEYGCEYSVSYDFWRINSLKWLRACKPHELLGPLTALDPSHEDLAPHAPHVHFAHILHRKFWVLLWSYLKEWKFSEGLDYTFMLIVLPHFIRSGNKSLGKRLNFLMSSAVYETCHHAAALYLNEHLSSVHYDHR